MAIIQLFVFAVKDKNCHDPIDSMLISPNQSKGENL